MWCALWSSYVSAGRSRYAYHEENVQLWVRYMLSLSVALLSRKYCNKEISSSNSEEATEVRRFRRLEKKIHVGFFIRSM